MTQHELPQLGQELEQVDTNRNVFKQLTSFVMEKLKEPGNVYPSCRYTEPLPVYFEQ